VNTLRYLWAHPYGRLALLMIAVAVLGLTLHYWSGFLLLAGLRLPTGPYSPAVTAKRAGNQMTRKLDVSETSRRDRPMTRHE
jgi:hypothetical protein